MDINLVTEGLKFMVLGMVTVFLFLIMMVIVLKIQSSLILKFFAKSQATTSNAISPTTAQNDTTLVAVITSAITQFKNKK